MFTKQEVERKLFFVSVGPGRWGRPSDDNGVTSPHLWFDWAWSRQDPTKGFMRCKIAQLGPYLRPTCAGWNLPATGIFGIEKSLLLCAIENIFILVRNISLFLCAIFRRRAAAHTALRCRQQLALQLVWWPLYYCSYITVDYSSCIHWIQLELLPAAQRSDRYRHRSERPIDLECALDSIYIYRHNIPTIARFNIAIIYPLILYIMRTHTRAHTHVHTRTRRRTQPFSILSMLGRSLGDKARCVA